MGRDLIADVMERLAHLDAQSLGLVATRDRAAVVVRQQDHWNILEGRVEDALGADVEVCAVADRERPCHARSYRRTTPAMTPQISLSSVSSMSGYGSWLLAGAR